MPRIEVPGIRVEWRGPLACIIPLTTPRYIHLLELVQSRYMWYHDMLICEELQADPLLRDILNGEGL